MKRNAGLQSVSRHDAVRIMSVCNILQNAAQRLFALRFYFFAFYFARFPIRENCP